MRSLSKAFFVFCSFMFSVSSASAASARVCAKSFDYEALPNQSSEVNGVWEGLQKFSSIASGCVGFVVLGIEPNTQALKIRYFWNMAEGNGVHNNSNLGDGNWKIHPQPDGTYVLRNAKGQMVLKLISPNELRGKFVYEGQSYDMEFTKKSSARSSIDDSIESSGVEIVEVFRGNRISQ